jgi:hypothetical protein
MELFTYIRHTNTENIELELGTHILKIFKLAHWLTTVRYKAKGKWK